MRDLFYQLNLQGIKVKEAEVEIRVVAFCALENPCEYRLATNLPVEGEIAVS